MTRAIPAYDASGAETLAEVRPNGDGIIIRGHHNPTSELVLDRDAAYKFAIAVFATINPPDLWWWDRTKVGLLVRFMLVGGWTNNQIVNAMEMPWNYTEVFYRAKRINDETS